MTPNERLIAAVKGLDPQQIQKAVTFGGTPFGLVAGQCAAEVLVEQAPLVLLGENSREGLAIQSAVERMFFRGPRTLEEAKVAVGLEYRTLMDMGMYDANREAVEKALLSEGVLHTVPGKETMVHLRAVCAGARAMRELLGFSLQALDAKSFDPGPELEALQEGLARNRNYARAIGQEIAA